MSKSNNKISTIFYRMAGVAGVLLVCVPLAALIFSALYPIPWSSIGNICVLAGAAIVICSGIGLIINILEGSDY
jgi:hypothetical protein